MGIPLWRKPKKGAVGSTCKNRMGSSLGRGWGTFNLIHIGYNPLQPSRLGVWEGAWQGVKGLFLDENTGTKIGVLGGGGLG